VAKKARTLSQMSEAAHEQIMLMALYRNVPTKFSVLAYVNARSGHEYLEKSRRIVIRKRINTILFISFGNTPTSASGGGYIFKRVLFVVTDF
jgi:hypothetical protein